MDNNNQNQIKLCEDYIDKNYKTIAQLVNKQFELERDSIREDILAEIKKYLNDPKLVHYEWYDDGCTYDFSGKLKKDGLIDFNQTIASFLNNEYTGDTEATYISHYGLYHTVYGDKLSYETLELACKILHKVILSELKKNVDYSISEGLLYELESSIDQVYDNSYAFEFFNYKFPIEFVGISDIKLCTLIDRNNNNGII